MPAKRPNDGWDESGNVKRSKVASHASPSTAAPAIPSAASIQAQIQAARSKIQAQLSSSGTAAALAATLSSPAPLAQPASSSAPPSAVMGSRDDIASKVEAIKKRLAAQSSAVPSAFAASSTASSQAKPSGIHPLLMPSKVPGLGSSATKPQPISKAPKFSTVSANSRVLPTSRKNQKAAAVPAPPQTNPYLAVAEAESTELANGHVPKRSTHKQLTFHRPGRHVAAAEDARREAQMEDLKRRIQESARRAGMQEEVTGEEKLIKRLPPPEVEWWDLSLLPTKSYDCVGNTVDGGATPLITGPDTPIDHLIQHPIRIPAPSEKIKVQIKPLILTAKERKKMRRVRRAADLEDKRDRIKLGELPPDAPKVKLANIVRVLASESVADPTKVEARVRRDIAARKDAHERDNEERKLTHEQRKAKRLAKAKREEEKGLGCVVFRIKHLTDPSHKFKVRRNAQQFHVTGLTIFHPTFALVVVEGSAKALKGYKHLMLHRIRWTEAGRKRDGGGSDDDEDEDGSAAAIAQAAETRSAWATTGDDDESVNLADNTCDLVFEGPITERNCPTTGFKAHRCPTDSAAKQVLGPKLAGYWDVARRWNVTTAD